MNLKVRQIVNNEYHVLEDFLYYAIFVPAGVNPPPREIIFEPEIFIYIKEFGGKNNFCVLAEIGRASCRERV